MWCVESGRYLREDGRMIKGIVGRKLDTGSVQQSREQTLAFRHDPDRGATQVYLAQV